LPFENEQQEAHVTNLLRRHWNTIALRLRNGCMHRPEFRTSATPAKAAMWAMGFLVAITWRHNDWFEQNNEVIDGLIAVLVALSGRKTELKLSAKLRDDAVASLPRALLFAYRFWHEPQASFARRR